MPCCTTNEMGSEEGDPLNLFVIGDHDDVYDAFIRAGWDETETIYRAILWVSSQAAGFSEIGWFDWESPITR